MSHTTLQQFKYQLTITFLIVLGSTFTKAQSNVYTIDNVPNSRLTCQNCFVTNPDGILSLESENKINTMLTELEQTTGVEIAIVALQSIGNQDFNEFGYELFNKWGIGKANKNNGLLILLISNERAVRFETGKGLEGIMPDAYCSDVMNKILFPYFKRGNFDKGFEEAVAAITQHLTTQEALEELLLNQDKTQSHLVEFLTIYFSICFFIFIALLIWSSHILNHLHGDNEQQYYQMGNILVINTIFAFGFPIPVLFFLLWLKKRRKQIRQKTIKCPDCGSYMHLLSEQEEDAYLLQSQQTEEKLKSVDYDVWLCNTCQKTKIFKYIGKTSYTTCPHCGALAYKLESDKVLLDATSSYAGKGQKTYICKNCHQTQKENYIIPQIIIAPTTISGSHGGSSFGGGFGGGISGGGGASGHF